MTMGALDAKSHGREPQLPEEKLRKVGCENWEMLELNSPALSGTDEAEAKRLNALNSGSSTQIEKPESSGN